jgi:hypothetical protein
MTITEEKLENLIKMMDSTVEDQVVALTIINNDVKDNPVAVLIAYKFSKAKVSLWEENAPLALAFVQKVSNGSENLNLSFKNIFDAILKNKYSAENMELFLNKFSKFLTDQCLGFGYNFIESIDMKIKLKNEE